MRLLRLLFAAALLLPLCAAGLAHAQFLGSGPTAGGSQNGDDLTVCCSAIFTPPTSAPSTPVLFEPQAVGCTAIKTLPAAINGCPGVVLGCQESAFICQPSSTVPNTKDCACVQFGSIAPPPPPAP